jgi:hypothetical protein
MINKNIQMMKKGIGVIVIFVLTGLANTISGRGVSMPCNGGFSLPGTTVMLPFRLDIDPMERLLLINFEQDPDSVYIGFEPQVFDDTVNGHGHLVIGWRRDGFVDVYHMPALTLDPEKYDIAGKGLNRMISAEFTMASFDVLSTGVQASYRFTDIYRREVFLEIAERNQRKRNPFGLLAPMGSAAESPSSMPLILLHDFYFVRVKNTSITIAIDGQMHTPDRLAMPLDFRRMYFTRYSPKPLIATLNPAYDGPLERIEINSDETVIVSENHVIHTAQREGANEICSIVILNSIHPVTISFSPAFPDLTSMPGDTVVNGQFAIQGHPSTGSIGGHYVVERKSNTIFVEMTPSGGWDPRPDRLSLRLMYSAVKMFRTWPSEYRWRARITENEDGVLWMKSGWSKGQEPVEEG